MKKERATEIRQLISLFDREDLRNQITPIQCFVVPGNEKVKRMAKRLDGK